MIAVILNYDFAGSVSDLSQFRSGYIIPPRTLLKAQLRDLGILSSSRFYGCAVEHKEDIYKTILHSDITKSTDRDGYSFSNDIVDIVLPGVSVTSKEGFYRGYKEMKDFGVLRVKLANESDGNGQFVISEESQLAGLLDKISVDSLVNEGLVIEPDLINPSTISVGSFQIRNNYFSFIAKQVNDRVMEDGRLRDRYLGADVKVTRGGMANLMNLENNEIDVKQAIKDCLKFHDCYVGRFNPWVSRISYDYLSGVDAQGIQRSGVTDITARLGGTCPALIMAASELIEKPSLEFVNAEVRLNYLPDYIPKGRIFVNHPFLVISAQLV